ASPNRRRPEGPTRSVFAISAHSGGSASPVEVSAVVGGDERTEVACKRGDSHAFFPPPCAATMPQQVRSAASRVHVGADTPPHVATRLDSGRDRGSDNACGRRRDGAGRSRGGPLLREPTAQRPEPH